MSQVQISEVIAEMTDLIGDGRSAYSNAYNSAVRQCIAILEARTSNGIAPRDGWVLVPVEPTDDMAHAAVTHIDEDPHYYYKWNTAKDVYKAMLATSPKPEDV